MLKKSILQATILILVVILQSATAQTLDIWIRAFIPNPENASGAEGYIVPRPEGESGSVVKVDAGIVYCFLTDNRGFSSESTSTSRLETRFTITSIDESTAVISPEAHRVKASLSREVDCESGMIINELEGRVDRDNIGNPAVADGLVQLIGQSQGTNTIPVFGFGPSIDYSFDFTWNPQSRELITAITFGNFPALEVYARQDGSAWTTVLQALPSGSPWALGGDGLGVGTTRVTATITLAE